MIFRDRIRKNDIYFAFLLATSFILCAIVYQESFYFRNNPERIRKEFFKTLSEKENFLKSVLARISIRSPDKDDLSRSGINSELNSLYEKKGLVFFIFEQDSLIYWSQNSVEVPLKEARSKNNPQQFIRLSNGWYELMTLRKRGFTYIGLILIKSEFQFENDFLKNYFQHDFQVPFGTKLLPKIDKNSTVELLLEIPSKINPSEIHLFVLFLFYFCSLIFLIIGIYRSYLRFEPVFISPFLFTGSLILDLIILRFFLFYFRIPHVLYNSELFGPVHFSSSSLLPSFGDFFVNSFLLLMAAYIIYLHLKPSIKTRFNHFSGILVSILLLVIVSTGFIFALYLVRSLLINSTISFNLQNISGLNFYSILGFSIIAAIILSWFLISVCLLKFLPVLLQQEKSYIKTIFKPAQLSTTKIIFYLIFFSIIITLVLDQVNASIEREKRKFLAIKIGTQHDPMAEMMFAEIEDELLGDSILVRIEGKKKLNPAEIEDSVDNYLMHRYFSESWNNYLVQITVCSPEKGLRIQPQNFIVNCGSYFQDILKESGKKTGNDHFYFLDYGYGSKNYLSIIPLITPPGKNNPSYTAYIEISSRQVFRDLGYPELLTDTRQSKMPDITGYSYAFYRDSKLIYRFGKYQYPLTLDPTRLQKYMKDHFYESENMDHYFHRIDNRNILILSKKENTFLDHAAPFSYLFFFFAIFMILFYLIVRFPVLFSFNYFRLENRLQVSMITILTGSLLITGFLILYYIIKLNTDKNLDNLNERSHSVLVELQHHLGSEDTLTVTKPENLNDLLTKFSNVFFTDVNLYYPDGRMLATSRPKVFEQGLISGLMNNQAYFLLRFDHRSTVIQKESIGTYHYYSAYLPFFNDRNELLAYLNLPYFARQEDLSREISTFLIAFVNSYIFIIIAGIFISLVVSSYISRPVRLLTSGLGTLAFGKPNDKLKWSRKDEIGKLVEEYNRLIDELARSAELLARTERESAWREMARQIAHEIKNPLTPMKLSIQHLLKSWEERAPDWDARVKRFTETMIGQIESLSAIASDFSDFAKMPAPLNESLDLNEIIRNVMALYREIPSITITFTTENVKTMVLADSRQLHRVFTNLINNAIQAIGSGKRGEIKIKVQTENQKQVITVSDNGSGIPTDQVKKVFEPNFTTKSGGMGLGLAIVKSIVIEAGGEITFHSEENKGTTFIISMPQNG